MNIVYFEYLTDGASLLIAEGVRRRHERHVSCAAGHRRVYLLPDAVVRAARHVAQSHRHVLPAARAWHVATGRARPVVRLHPVRVRLVRVDGADLDERLGGHAQVGQHLADDVVRVLSGDATEHGAELEYKKRG